MHFERIHQEYHNEGVEVAFAVSALPDYTRTQQLPRFKQEYKVSYPALDDKDSTVVNLYKLNSDPRVAKCLIIDRDGIVRLVGEFTPWLEMAETLETVLGRAKRLDLSTPEKAIESLGAAEGYVRWQAAKSLGEMKEKAAVEPLIKALSDESEPVRELVTAALGKIGDRKAVEPLLPLLQDKSSLVRGAVIEALTEMKDERTIPALVKALADLEFRVKAADALTRINKPELVSKALEENRPVLGPAGAHMILGRAYMQAGNIRPAIEQYLATVKNSDDRRTYVSSFSSSAIDKLSLREIFLRDFVATYQTEGKLKEITAVLEEMLSEPSKNAALHEMLGAIYAAQGLHEKASEVYEKALGLDPDHFRLYAQLASSYSRAGMHDKATETAKRMAKKIPGDAYSYGLAAKVHSECGLYDDAIAFYEKAVSLASSDSEKGIHRVALAKCYAVAGKHDRAVAEYTKLAKTASDPSHKSLALRGAAECYLYAKRHGDSEAAKAYEEVMATDPEGESAQFWTSLAHACITEGKLDEAIEASNKAISIDSNSVWAWVNLACASERKGNLDDAVEACKKALAIDPNHAMAWNNLGYAYIRQGKLQEGIEASEKALAIDPNHPHAAGNLVIAWNDLADIYIKQEQPEKVIEACTKALATNPKSGRSFCNLAQAHYLKSDYESAWKFVRKSQEAGYEVPAEFLEKLRAKVKEPEK